MRRLAGLMMVLAASTAAAEPQKPAESVTVTGTRDCQLLQKFVQSFAAPARISGCEHPAGQLTANDLGFLKGL